MHKGHTSGCTSANPITDERLGNIRRLVEFWHGGEDWRAIARDLLAHVDHLHLESVKRLVREDELRDELAEALGP